MTQRTLNAKDFANAMRVTVPKSVRARGKKVFLIVATKVHGELVLGARVRTGYMRASIAASTDGVPFPTPPAKSTSKLARGFEFYAAAWPLSQQKAVGAIAAAVKRLTKLTFAFGATYAQYDPTGAPALVKRVKAMVPSFVRDAVRQAQRLTASEAAD